MCSILQFHVYVYVLTVKHYSAESPACWSSRMVRNGERNFQTSPWCLCQHSNIAERSHPAQKSFRLERRRQPGMQVGFWKSHNLVFTQLVFWDIVCLFNVNDTDTVYFPTSVVLGNHTSVLKLQTKPQKQMRKSFKKKVFLVSANYTPMETKLQ